MANTTSSEAGFGTLLKRGGATIIDVDSMSCSLDVGEVEMTHMESQNSFQEFKPTTKGLTVSFTGNFVPATHENDILADITAGTESTWTIVWADSGSTTWSFSGFPTQFTPEASTDGKLGMSGTIRATGNVDYSA